MKILTQVGSKDRFLEMFQRVNKIRLNESITDASMQNGNLAKSAFDELVNGSLKIQETNSEVNGNESFVEIVGADDAGNVATFKFRVTSSQGDQDGVLTVDSATLINFKIKTQSFSGEMPEGENTIKQLNAERGQEMIDVVSEYVQDDSEAPEAEDSLYEDAIKLIDKVPYKKGTEDMQTNAAYADQKPTNPKLRVQSTELQKFVNEIQDYDGDDLGASVPNFRMPDFEEPELEPEDVAEPISPEKEKLILQAYENLMARNSRKNPNYFPTTPEILAEIDKMQGVTKPQPVRDPDSHMAMGKERVYPKEAEPFLQEEDEKGDYPDQMGKTFKTKSKYPKKKKKIQTTVRIGEEFDVDQAQNRGRSEGENLIRKNIMSLARRFDFGKLVRAYEELLKMHGELRNTEEYQSVLSSLRDAIAKYFNLNNIPVQGEDVQNFFASQASRLGEGEEEKEPIVDPDDEFEKQDDGMSLEPKGDEVEKIAQDKEEVGDEIEGGKAEGKSPLEYDPAQILKGMKIELEHTDDPMKAVEIAMDHLEELPDYYDRLEKMEADAKTNGAGSTDPMNPSGCFDDRQLAKDFPPESFKKDDDETMTDVLLGYEPKNVGDEVDEEMVGSTGAAPVVGGGGVEDKEAEESKRFEEYQKKDINTLNDGQKKDYFQLWTKFIGMNYE